MGTPYSLFNQYRIYDTAVKEFLNGFLVDYGRISGSDKTRYPILSIMSTPERAFARMYSVLIRKGWINEATKSQTLDAAKLYKTVPLPFISFARKESTLDFTRSNAPFIFNKFERMSDGSTIDHPHPVPYDIVYEMTLWCKKRYTANFFEEWVNTLVGYRGSAPQELFLHIDLGMWGVQIHGFRYDSMYETSNHMGLLYGFRDYTYSMSWTLKGWLYKRPDYDNDRSNIFVSQTHKYYDIDRSVTPASTHQMSTGLSTRNLMEYLSSVYNIDAMFETKDADVEVSTESHDDRYNYLVPYIDGNPPAYKMTFNSVGSYVRTKRMLLHNYNTIVAIRFTNKRTQTPGGFFDIMDKNLDIIRRVEIPTSANWSRMQEIFVRAPNGLFLNWSADNGEIIVDNLSVFIREAYRGSNEFITDSEMNDLGIAAWTPLGGAVLSKVAVPSGNALRVDTINVLDGVSQDTVVDRLGIYFLEIDIEEATADYQLTFTNGNESDTILIKPLVDRSVCLVLFTNSNLSVRIEQVGTIGHITINEISIRSFKGSPLLQI